MRRAPATSANLASATDRARDSLREMIRTGKIHCGQRIDQRSLAKQLDLTTAPLREALCSLESEGLVVRIPGLGIFCRAYTVDEIEELLEIRAALEGLAARRAAVHASQAALDELYMLGRRISDPNSDLDPKQRLRDHIQFHLRIAKCSGNSSLQQILERKHLIEEVLYNITAKYWPFEPNDHVALVDALAAGDPDKAEQAFREHIDPAYRRQVLAYRERFGNKPIL